MSVNQTITCHFYSNGLVVEFYHHTQNLDRFYPRPALKDCVCYFHVTLLYRYEKQLEQEEQAYQQQRRRLYAEVQEEKERVALQAQKQRQELDEAREALEVI